MFFCPILRLKVRVLGLAKSALPARAGSARGPLSSRATLGGVFSTHTTLHILAQATLSQDNNALIHPPINGSTR